MVLTPLATAGGTESIMSYPITIDPVTEPVQYKLLVREVSPPVEILRLIANGALTLTHPDGRVLVFEGKIVDTLMQEIEGMDYEGIKAWHARRFEELWGE